MIPRRRNRPFWPFQNQVLLGGDGRFENRNSDQQADSQGKACSRNSLSFGPLEWWRKKALSLPEVDILAHIPVAIADTLSDSFSVFADSESPFNGADLATERFPHWT